MSRSRSRTSIAPARRWATHRQHGRMPGSRGTARREAGETRCSRVGKRLALHGPMRSAVLSVALAGCAYSPGSFSHFAQGFPGQRTTVGCIDLAVERRPDTPGGSAVLAYDFGNRCDHPATIDFSQVKVRARTYDGKDLA